MELDASGFYDEFEVNRVVAAVELNPKVRQSDLAAVREPVVSRLPVRYREAMAAEDGRFPANVPPSSRGCSITATRTSRSGTSSTGGYCPCWNSGVRGRRDDPEPSRGRRGVTTGRLFGPGTRMDDCPMIEQDPARRFRSHRGGEPFVQVDRL